MVPCHGCLIECQAVLPSLDADMCHQGQQADVPDLQGREVRRHEACLRRTRPHGHGDITLLWMYMTSPSCWVCALLSLTGTQALTLQRLSRDVIDPCSASSLLITLISIWSYTFSPSSGSCVLLIVYWKLEISTRPRQYMRWRPAGRA
jgi:hypothetical protein